MRLKIKWLHSHYRARLLAFRYFVIGRFFGKKSQVEVYLSLNDPHSFMLVQMLARLQKNYRVNFKVLFIWGCLPGVTIAPKLYRQWAIKDAKLIAERYQLVNIVNEPSMQLLTTGQQAWQLLANSIENAEQVFLKTWGDQFSEYFQTSTPPINHQVKNQMRLQAKGHYAPASILFAGDWFVGVDRLYHFENLLLKFGLVDKVSVALAANGQHDTAVMPVSLTNTPRKLKTAIPRPKKPAPMVIYLSLRSPYSYLGLVQAIRLAERSELELVIKPVLPLLMRGASMPLVKQKYIYLDAVREAKKLAIEFTGFVDPLGDGVINVYRLFGFAQQHGKASEYMLACFRAVYVEGIDLAKPGNVDNIVKNLALDSADANVYADQHDWRQWADSNQMALTKLNFWGVPCFSYGEFSYWGQDRLPFLAKNIQHVKVAS